MKFLIRYLYLLTTITTYNYWTLGADLYNPSHQVCCMGKVHNITPDPEASNFCCGQEPYDLRTYLCCQNVILPRSGNTISCCGAATYDVTTSLCCDDNVVDLGQVVNYSLPYQEYNSGADTAFDIEAASPPMWEPHHHRCCGREAYDVATHMCCESEIRPRSNQGLKCCDGLEYDITREICCSGRIHPDPGHEDVTILCCNTNTYNARKEQCCNGHVRQKPDPSGTYTCCGDQLQDTQSEMCCEQTVASKFGADNVTLECCGETTYNPSTHICCDGVPQVRDLLDEDAKWTACCGTETYSEAKATCCSGTIRFFPDPNYPSKCCGETLITNPNSEICCHGQLFRRLSPLTACCRGTTYEIDQDVCCQGRRRIRISDNDQCCGDNFYNMATQVCCYENGYQILNKTGARTSCCSQSSDMDYDHNINY